jgi:hypothetical protein
MVISAGGEGKYRRVTACMRPIKPAAIRNQDRGNGGRVTRSSTSGKIDYSLFAIPKVRVVGPVKAPKGQRPAQRARKTKLRARNRQRRSVKDQVFERDGARFGGCVFINISPICTVAQDDRHEIVPIGVGGKVTTANCVAVCRACHDALHGEPGVGRRLKITWTGAAPDADAGNFDVGWRAAGWEASDNVRTTEPVLHGPELPGHPNQG